MSAALRRLLTYFICWNNILLPSHAVVTVFTASFLHERLWVPWCTVCDLQVNAPWPLHTHLYAPSFTLITTGSREERPLYEQKKQPLTGGNEWHWSPDDGAISCVCTLNIAQANDTEGDNKAGWQQSLLPDSGCFYVNTSCRCQGSPRAFSTKARCARARAPAETVGANSRFLSM